MGYDAAYADLTALGDRLAKAGKRSDAALQEMLQDAGEKIAKRMRELVPVRTGRLKSDIRVVSMHMKVVVGPTTVPYAAFVEFGTGARGELYNKAYLVSTRGTVLVIDTKKASGLRGQKASPYARPAAAEYVASLGPRAAQVGLAMITGGQGA